MNFLTVDWANNWISRCAVAAKEHREALIELDRAIGDADHGENIDRGFSAVLEKLDGQELATPSEVLKITAATLISTVGGASGPLLGTAFLRASKAIKDKEKLDAAAVADLIDGALEGITARGKATPGRRLWSMHGVLLPKRQEVQQITALQLPRYLLAPQQTLQRSARLHE